MSDGQLPRLMVCEPAKRALRIGFIYSRLPFPMTRGDQLTVAHLLSYLHSRGHIVDFFTLATGGEMSPEQAAWLKSVCRRLEIVNHGLTDVLRGSAAALTGGLPFQVGYFNNRHLARIVDKAVRAGGYDIIYNYYLRTAPAVPAIFRPNRTTFLPGGAAAAFLAAQLSQTLNTRRIYENERSILKRLFYRIECFRLRRYEARVWQQFSKTVLIGMRDVEDVRNACRHEGQPEITNWVLSAHGTDVEQFRPAREDEVVPGRVVFSGSMRYQPNVQAALWFVDNCWMSIRKRHPEAELYIVGQSPIAVLRNLNGKEGIFVTGSVPDIGEHIRRAAVCVNPMLAAGGMQNKLIEYMACCKAVVATSVANEGIGAPPSAIAIEDEAPTFALRTAELLNDRVQAGKLGQAAREFVVREWTWERQFAKLEGEFFSALNAPG